MYPYCEARPFSICSILIISDFVAPKIKPYYIYDFKHSDASMMSPAL